MVSESQPITVGRVWPSRLVIVARELRKSALPAGGGKEWLLLFYFIWNLARGLGLPPFRPALLLQLILSRNSHRNTSSALYWCQRSLPIAVTNTMTYRLQSITKESLGRNWSRDHGRTLYTGWLSLFGFFFNTSGLPGQGGISTVFWALLYQSWIKKMSYTLIHRTVQWRQFLNWGSLFPDDPRLCQVEKKNTSTQSLKWFPMQSS